MKRYLPIFLFLILNFPAFSTHIVGGEMIYDALGNNKYRITLKIYRDCSPGTPPFDSQSGPIAYITVRDVNDQVFGVFDIGNPVITQVPPVSNNPCLIPGSNVCIEQGVYTYTATLPPKTGGYTLIYQACCRNSVMNITNYFGNGSTYYAKIPGPESGPTNNSPRFSKLPPIFLCEGLNFEFDHSAEDPDGDELVYSLCTPYIGLSNCCPNINGASYCSGVLCDTAALPPPYLTVLYSGSLTAANPIHANPSFSIDPATGLLSGTPTAIGSYAVCICIQEIRNNEVINTHYRDFQFTVIPCQVSVLGSAAGQPRRCQGNTIRFHNQSLNEAVNPNYLWDFGVLNTTSDTSTLVHPIYTFPDTGKYVVTLISNPGSFCTDTFRQNVYIYPVLDINFKKQKAQCFSNNSFSFIIDGSYTSKATYQWNFPTSASQSTSALENPTGIHFNQPGLYFVKLKVRQFGCTDTFIDTLRVYPKPIARINNLPSVLCDPAEVGFSNGSSSTLPIKYHWRFSNGETSSAFEPKQIFSPSGLYEATLLVETTSPCKDTSLFRMANILVNPSPVASFSTTPKEVSIFEPYVDIKSLSGHDVVKTYFDFGDGQYSYELQNTHTYSEFGDYTVTQTVNNQFGCSDTTSRLVKVLPEFRFWIPNSFTPDGNEKNDLFIPSTYGVSVYEFEVFDRWGKALFKTASTAEGWNGSYKGTPCAQGIYMWKISFRNAVTQERETRLGHVTLIRNP